MSFPCGVAILHRSPSDLREKREFSYVTDFSGLPHAKGAQAFAGVTVGYSLQCFSTVSNYCELHHNYK